MVFILSHKIRGNCLRNDFHVLSEGCHGSEVRFMVTG